MPNWVYNSMAISGPREELDRFIKQAQNDKQDEFYSQEDRALTFWNFVRPDDSILGEYRRGQGIGIDEMNSPNNWYNWNIENWGTKWDACDVELQDDETDISYRFNTAWSPPEPVLREMVRQYPKLWFEIVCSEEQGWGVKYEGEGGILAVIDEWDIPTTHEESVDRTGYCPCDGWEPIYSDCPKSNEAEAEQVHESV